MIVFDIETGPLPGDDLLRMMPPLDVEAVVPHPGEFDPGSVALGNLKDAAKIDAKIAQAREAHLLSIKTLAARRIEAQRAHCERFAEKAALSACTGVVKAIGLWFDINECPQLHLVDPNVSEDVTRAEAELPLTTVYWSSEEKMIRTFWGIITSNANHTVIGHNIHGFDLPFLMRRSWILGVDVPASLKNGRYFNPRFVDTMVEWQCGGREMIGLDAIDKALGGGGKPDDCTGADFARLFDNGGEDRTKALKYLRNDLAMTRRVADAMQIL